MAPPDGSEPERPERPDDEHLIEVAIGKLLRACVIATAVVVVVGAVLYLPGALHAHVAYGTFHGEPVAFRSVAGILRGAASGDGLAIIESGMLLLVLTPILRVAFSALAFLYERDIMYVGLTLVVLGLLLYSLLGS